MNQSLLVRTGGEPIRIKPAVSLFTREELVHFVGGGDFELLATDNPETVAIINADPLLHGPNPTISTLMPRVIQARGSCITGDVVVCDRRLLSVEVLRGKTIKTYR